MTKKEDFPLKFEHYWLREIITRMLECNDNLRIGRVEGDTTEPEPILAMVDQLREIDKRMMSGELKYIWHVESGHFDGGGVVVQAYLCEADLFEEWDRAYDKACDIETGRHRWIPPEMFTVAPFLDKYSTDPRLIELWSADL